MKAMIENNFECNTASDYPLDIFYLEKSIWEKAQHLSMDEISIVQAPGDESAWMVKATVTNDLIMPKCHYEVVFLCDDKCLSYRSMKMCSHIVAPAIKNWTANLFKWYHIMKYTPNFTTLAESGSLLKLEKSQCKRELPKSMQNKSKV